jgi:uncharacterized protein YqeY
MLKENIHKDSVEALKLKDQFKLGVLRMLLASVITKEKEKRYKISKEKRPEGYSVAEEQLVKESELTDEQVLETITSEIKKRKDAIALYTQGNRPELAENEKKEIEVLMKYMPEQLSAEDLKKMVAESIAKTGANEIKDMGKVMADLNPKIRGKADGGEVSKIVKELLNK